MISDLYARHIERMPGVPEQVIGAIVEREARKQKSGDVEKTDYKKRNIWGE